MKKNFWLKIYRKYLIKSPIIFYGYLGICLFIVLGVGSIIKLDMIETYDCCYEKGLIDIPSLTKKIGDKATFYVNRNEKIYPVEVKDYIEICGDTHILWSNKELSESGKKISGQIDVIVGKESLLKHILK